MLVNEKVAIEHGLNADEYKIAEGMQLNLVAQKEGYFIFDESKSLIILDEIGRGTSTYDGLAIAQAVAEFIHEENSLSCKTLFYVLNLIESLVICTR